MIFCPEKYKAPVVNVNEQLKLIRGELDDKQCRITLAKFLRANLGLTVELLTGTRLYAYQEFILKAMFSHNFILNVLTRGGGKTVEVSKDHHLIEKTRGMVSTQDLFGKMDFSEEKTLDVPDLELWNGDGWQKVNKVIIQPQKECLKVTTSQGYFLTGSTNHLIKVLEGGKIIWKRYHDIKLGDYACISRNICKWGESATNIEMDEAYLVGLAVGDGSYGNSQTSGVVMTSADNEILAFCEKYPCGPRHSKQGTKAFSLRLKKEFCDYLFAKYQITKTTSYFKVIPQPILKSSELLASFLSGLMDTDGTADKDRLRIGFCTTSKSLAEEVQKALLTFGIVCRLKERKSPSPFGKAWHLDINGTNAVLFGKSINFRLNRKRDILQKHINKNVYGNSNIDVIPGIKGPLNLIREKYVCPKKLKNLGQGQIVRNSDSLNLTYYSLGQYLESLTGKGVLNDELKNYREIEEEHFFFDRITSIEPTIKNCVDFNIPDGERYWSNGFISHNSFLSAIFCFLYMLFNPGTKIIIAGPTFRTSRNIFNELEKIVKNPKAKMLADCFTEEPSKRTDIYTWNINGGSIVAIPLNGEKIRGFRAHILILDEYLLLSKAIVDNVLKPFLAVNSDVTERQLIQDEEEELIKIGAMKESERTIFQEKQKMVCLSSASYTFENLYQTFKEWRDEIYSPEMKTPAKFFISQLSYEAMPPGLISSTVINEAKGEGSNDSFKREWEAQFTDGNDGYFSARKMMACTIPDTERPNLVLSGDKKNKYILAIDSNFSNSESADHFAMAVLELDDEKKDTTLVHQYANAGDDLKNHINYFYYLISYFNIHLIILDSAGGRRFIEAANLSEQFKMNHIEYDFINFDSDLEGEEYERMVREVRNQYNLLGRRICIDQYFTSNWIRNANEYLQSAIDHKKVWFASKIRACASFLDEVAATKIPLENLGYENISDLIDDQDILIDTVKKECALIEVKSTAKGTQSFDLPQHLKRSGGKHKARKDSYSALMLGVWGKKIYYSLMEAPSEPIYDNWVPIMIY